MPTQFIMIKILTGLIWLVFFYFMYKSLKKVFKKAEIDLKAWQEKEEQEKQEKLNIERERLAIERERLRLEQERLHNHK